MWAARACRGIVASHGQTVRVRSQVLGRSASFATTARDRYCFSFGVIADVQYADIPNGTNFREDEVRCYRGGLRVLGQAVEAWNSEAAQGAGCDFAAVMQLGDLIDGQNSGTYGAGLEFPEPRSETAWASVHEVIDKSRGCGDWFHLIGNHELYNFQHCDMPQRLHIPTELREPKPPPDTGVHNFYSFAPRPGWRFLVLDSYAQSILGRPDADASAQAAAQILSRNNPNPLDGSADFTAGLKGPDLRFIPYNGGLGEVQLTWMERELENAAAQSERVMVFSHIPLHPAASAYASIAWDYERALSILRATPPGQVAAVFSGHHHSGGYCTDVSGECEFAPPSVTSTGGSSSSHLIHFITVQSPLTNHSLSVSKIARAPQHRVRGYDNDYVAASRHRLARSEAAPCTAGQVRSELGLCNHPSDVEHSPFATVHVLEDCILIDGRGAIPSRVLALDSTP